MSNEVSLGVFENLQHILRNLEAHVNLESCAYGQDSVHDQENLGRSNLLLYLRFCASRK